MPIHPTAIVASDASLGAHVEIGPYCVVGAGAEIHEGVRLLSHVTIEGKTTLGAHCVVHPFVCLGGPPQHTGDSGQDTRLVIGPHTILREQVTIHRGTGRSGVTQVGAHCFIMVGCHIAHDCSIGNHVIMANQVALGGHVEVEDHAFLGGLVGVHQFTRIGEGAMIGGFSALGRDVPPYGIAVGNRSVLEGLNVRKLKRLHTPREEIYALNKLYAWLFAPDLQDKDSIPLMTRLRTIPAELMTFPKVKKVQDFLLASETRPICMPAGDALEGFQTALSQINI